MPGRARGAARREPARGLRDLPLQQRRHARLGLLQINTVHLERAGLNLRDLLDCKANIDFAYRLYVERGFQPWSTYNNGAYQKYLMNAR